MKFRRPWENARETGHGELVKTCPWSPPRAPTWRQSCMKRSHTIIPIDHKSLPQPLACEMEDSTVECRIKYAEYFLFYGGFLPLFAASSLPHLSPHRRCRVFPGMGRPSWASPEQTVYLKSFLPLLEQAKATIHLTTLYAQVYEGFLAQWIPEPVTPEPDTTPTPEQLEEAAKARLKKVYIISTS